MATIAEQINELHEATEELTAAWEALATAVARRLEGWDDDESRVADARRRVRTATGRANAALDQALAEGGEYRPRRQRLGRAIGSPDVPAAEPR
jgi:hypothetical protein